MADDIRSIELYQHQSLDTMISNTNIFPPALKKQKTKEMLIDDLSVDIGVLTSHATMITSTDPNLTVLETTIQLLSYVATQASSKLIRKLACIVMKEVWWQ